jgi:hypothetical protein
MRQAAPQQPGFPGIGGRTGALTMRPRAGSSKTAASVQQVLRRRKQRRSDVVPAEPIDPFAAARTRAISLCSVFRSPVEHYTNKILPSAAAEVAIDCASRVVATAPKYPSPWRS